LRQHIFSTSFLEFHFSPSKGFEGLKILAISILLILPANIYSVSVTIETGHSISVASAHRPKHEALASEELNIHYLPGETGICGRVLDSRGTPLYGATVMVVGTSYGAMTNASGEYEILDMPVGGYSLRASMVGMRISFYADQVEVRPGSVAVVDFMLVPEMFRQDDSIIIRI